MKVRDSIVSSTPRPAVRQVGGRGLLAALIAGGSTALVSSLARTFAPEAADFLPLQLGPTIFSTVAGVLGATLVFLLLTRVTHRPVRVFYIIAASVLGLSFVPDLTMIGSKMPGLTGATPLNVGILLVEHMLVAFISVGLLTTSGDPAQRLGEPSNE